VLVCSSIREKKHAGKRARRPYGTSYYRDRPAGASLGAPEARLEAALAPGRFQRSLEFLGYLVTGLCQEGGKPSGKGLVSHSVSIEVESYSE